VGDRQAPWRHPTLAPIYGAVIAFGVVLLASFMVGKQVQGPPTPTPAPSATTTGSGTAAATATITVSVSAVQHASDLTVEIPDGDERMNGATVTVSDRAGNVLESAVLDGTGQVTWSVPSGGWQVCLRPPDGWAVAHPVPQADTQSCQQLTELSSGVEFRLERS
jgi:hypothetical protein